jgi:AAA domain-containing protein
MYLPDRFPPELLNQPLAAKLTYVRHAVFRHPLLTSICDTITPLLEDNEDPLRLLYLIGPTGVGKTVALQRIARHLSLQTQPEQVPPSEAARPLRVTIPTIAATTFSRNDYLYPVLQALATAVDTHSTHGSEKHSSNHEETKARGRAPQYGRTVEVYEELIAQLRFHQPRAIILDDAHHIMYTARRAVLAAYVGVIRDMAAATGIKHILVGTYDLLPLTTVDAQASRMSHVVHFPRYQHDLPGDIQKFRAVLRSIQQHLPFHEEPQLVRMADYCWEQCIGCVGILINWIQESTADALRDNHSTLTPPYLERYALSAHARAVLRSEIVHGEAWWAAEDSLIEDIPSESVAKKPTLLPYVTIIPSPHLPT